MADQSKQGKRIFYKRRRFWFIVGIPNILSMLYFGGIASPEYVSQSSLVVYQANQETNQPTLSLNQSQGGMSVEGDYLVSNYISSWSGFEAQDQAEMRKEWGSGDVISRFGGALDLFRDTPVALWDYYKGHVKTSIDQDSAIMTVTVTGYDPDYVKILNQSILDSSGRAVNDMNKQAYNNAEAFFKDRVNDAKISLKEAIIAQSKLQRDNEIVDPKVDYSSQLELVDNLIDKKVGMEAQLSVYQGSTPNSQQAQSLRASIDEISKQIRMVLGNIHGGNHALTDIDGDFSYNNALIQNAENTLKGDEAQLMSAQQTALQHQYFMEYIAPPTSPPNPTEPDRLMWSSIVLVVTLFIFAVV